MRRPSYGAEPSGSVVVAVVRGSLHLLPLLGTGWVDCGRLLRLSPVQISGRGQCADGEKR